ncbi:Hypothetical_protein [Hexamita inflata]|uniref:Hypothetical_protein n=1 Tax=Hexamita inflata TaxID=28002 RepID=A0ABP1HWQ3_9EUKA
MTKIATQSSIKEVPAKPRQKNFEKAHKTKTKKKSTQTAEKGNDKLDDTFTKKKPDKPTQTKVIPNAKGNDKKIQSLKEKIAKLQRELQSQFDTAAAVMPKFKETKKKHDDQKITQKTNNGGVRLELLCTDVRKIYSNQKSLQFSFIVQDITISTQILVLKKLQSQQVCLNSGIPYKVIQGALLKKGAWQNEAQGSEAEREKVPSLKVTRSKDHQNAPIERRQVPGNLEKER